MIDQYVTLITSLPPHIPKLYATRQTPISRIKLEERLQMLEPDHAQDLAVIENLVHWDRMAIATTDEQMLLRGIETMQHLNNAFIKDIICWRLEERTAVAALRRRGLGLNAPTEGVRWGFGRWVRQIESHWHEPAFALEKSLPWLPEAHRLLTEKKYLAMERLLLSLVWDYYGRAVAGHYFDFEAVVVYVLRWNVIERWSRYNSEVAAHRLDVMVESGLDEYKAIFA